MSFIIISAERAELGLAVNSLRSKELRARLKTLGADPIRSRGMYDGVSEVSWLVRIDDQTGPTITDLTQLAADYDQESVLHVQNSGSASLIYIKNQSREPIGVWTEAKAVGPNEPHTKIGGRIYVCK